MSDIQAELNQGVDVSATDENGWTPLHKAIVYGYPGVVLLLLEVGADANVRFGVGGTPLWLAITDDQADPEIVALLLEHGADANAVGLAEEPGQMTHLHWASISGGPTTYAVIKHLLTYGADVQARDNFGTTPLHYASQTSDHSVIQLLLDHGAHINAKGKDDWTPLHAASWSDKPPNVDLLLRKGADFNARNSHGQTPCEYTVERHNTCESYYRKSDFDPAAMLMCKADDVEQAVAAQIEIIDLLCIAPDVQATIDAAVATAMQEATPAPERAGENETSPDPTIVLSDSIEQWSEPPPKIIDVSARYSAVLHTSAGGITVELLTEEAPNTVNNFVFLAREGFYDDVIFHRTIEGFMIQGGDPTGTGGGGPGYTFDDEPVQRAYSRGIMAMANAGPNTNGSQFFIMHADYPLPPNYTIFGQAVAGLETVDAIATAPTLPEGEGSTPVDPVAIQSVEITGP